MSEPKTDPSPPQGVDLSRPSVARVYDWYLGGTANWAIDRKFGEAAVSRFPLLKQIAVTNRLFLHRLVRHLAKLGVRQFVDIGAGVPTMGNTHEVADEVAPESRVVYIDHEPVAVAHSQVLLEQHGDPTRHAAINADLRNPDALWRAVLATGLIDLREPVALLLIAVLHVQQVDDNGVDIGPQCVARIRELLPPGAYLAISHGASEGVPADIASQLAELKRMYDTSSSPVIWRPPAEIDLFFGDFELMDPGTTWTALWHPEDARPGSPVLEFATPNESVVWAGLGRKPKSPR